MLTQTHTNAYEHTYKTKNLNEIMRASVILIEPDEISICVLHALPLCGHVTVKSRINREFIMYEL